MKCCRTYPRPTPATYPNGAGIPRKCFLFLFASDVEAMITVLNQFLFLLIVKRLKTKLFK